MSTPPAFGKYRVLHQIGSGVLGPVFRCYGAGRQSDALVGADDRLFAIKAIKVDLVPEDAARLADALRTLADRPDIDSGIVTPIDAGIEGAVPFLVYDYESGDALDVFLRQSGGLTLAQARPFITALGRAIDSAWDHGVGHGALHPRDVFIGSDLSDVRVSGFGVAQALESVGAKAPCRRPYAAPERLGGGSWDRRADIYAFAAIAQELLTRQPAGAGGAWREAITKAMAESPEDRPGRASEFVGQLFSRTPAVQAPAVPVPAPPAIASAPTEIEPPAAFDEMRPTRVSERVPVIDLSSQPRSEIQMPAPAVVAPLKFPWAATLAVAVAGIALGVVAGYELGFRRAQGLALPPAGAVAAVSVPSVTPATSPVGPTVEPVAQPTPTPEASPTPSVPPKPTPASASARKPRSGRATSASALGALEVDSRPRGATVSVDGRSVGVTPLRGLELSPGVHSVLIQLAGHRTVSHKVTVGAGEQQQVKVTLERIALPRAPRY